MNTVNQPIPGIASSSATGSGKSGVIFGSQARDQTGASGGTASGVYVSQEYYNPGNVGARFIVVISPTGNASNTVTFKVQVADPVSAPTIWSDLPLATTTAINGTGALTGTQLTIYPSAATTGTVVNQHLGTRWRGVATVAVGTLTFTVGGDYLA
jgi:hypothetical protein